MQSDEQRINALLQQFDTSSLPDPPNNQAHEHTTDDGPIIATIIGTTAIVSSNTDLWRFEISDMQSDPVCVSLTAAQRDHIRRIATVKSLEALPRAVLQQFTLEATITLAAIDSAYAAVIEEQYGADFLADARDSAERKMIPLYNAVQLLIMREQLAVTMASFDYAFRAFRESFLGMTTREAAERFTAAARAIAAERAQNSDSAGNRHERRASKHEKPMDKTAWKKRNQSFRNRR